MEEDIPKIAVRYSVQEEQTERGKERVEREQQWVEGIMARNGIITIIIL